ncbi:MAG: DUF3810 domain-containing protein [Ruminococcaceae bacterium]|nr:DUF3810 domain-containing protein [Oscillospiraceae bacterium]
MTKKKRAFPVWTLVMFALAAASGIIYLVFRQSEAFAEFYNTTVSAFLRFVFAKVSGVANFSLAEMLIFMAPVIIVYAALAMTRAVKRGNVYVIRIFASVLACGCFVWVCFVNLYAAGYSAVSVADKMELDTEDIGADELALTMLFVTQKINTLVAENDFSVDEKGATVMPYTLNEVCYKITAGFAAVNEGEDSPLVQEMKTRVKPVILSRPMTYTHISGVYSYFTGEANVNTNYPDYLVVSTAAHEMSHQRGIAPEDEASFTGYLALINSGDPYLEYCGYMDIYSYLSNALYKSGSTLWSKYRSMLCSEASAELRAYSDFFEEYRENVAEKVAESVNDTFLKSQGTEGTIAYDLVTELVVAHTVR